MTKINLPKVNDNIQIIQDDKPRDIFMSFGLLSKLTKVVGSPDIVGAISVDPELRDSIIAELLAERKKSGKVINPVADLEDIDVSVEDIEALLKWASEHLMGFFVRSLQQVHHLTENHRTVLEALQPSSDGPKV